VPNGAADNISSLVSTEVDIRGGYDLVLSASSDEVAAGCGERSACVNEYGRENDFSHVITGTVSAAGSSRYTLVLTLYKVGSNAAVRQVLNTLDRSPDSLLEGIPDLVVELLTGQRPVREEEAPKAARSKASLFNDGDDFNDELSPADDDESDEREDQSERKWMERDRHGRLTQPVGSEDDPLGLDEIDDLDLDLDELSSDHQTKKRAARAEREAAARAAHAEEERLAQVAEDERDKRLREQEIRDRAEERDRERLRREEEQRIAEERDRRKEEQRRRSRAEERSERERERARAEERSERERERARAEERSERERERARAEERSERERERERERARTEERRDREREAARSEARRAQERERERLEAEERERREELERYEDDDEEDVTIDAGIIIIESDQEEEGDDEDEEFIILIEEDDDEEPDYNRFDDRQDEQRYEDDRDYRDDRDDQAERDDRDYRDDLVERDDRDYRDDQTDRDRRDDRRSANSSRDRQRSGTDRNERSRSSRIGGYGSGQDDGGRIRGNARTTRNSSKTGRPPGAVRAFVGYNNYYLSFLKMGVEGSVYVLPALSLDFGVEAWMLWLREGEDLHLAARVLPNFLVGASYRMNVHHVIKPFVGGDVGTVIYAQKVEVAGSEIVARTPLFALVVAAKGGAEFELPKNFGLFVSVRVGVSISGDLEQDGLADIQQYVNETWSPTRVFFNVGFGARYRF